MSGGSIAQGLLHMGKGLMTIDPSHADGNLMAGLVIMAGVNACLWALCTWMFKSGYRLKA